MAATPSGAPSRLAAVGLGGLRCWNKGCAILEEAGRGWPFYQRSHICRTPLVGHRPVADRSSVV